MSSLASLFNSQHYFREAAAFGVLIFLGSTATILWCSTKMKKMVSSGEVEITVTGVENA
jgi:hypothetical protein